jgi:hypothetical protein
MKEGLLGDTLRRVIEENQPFAPAGAGFRLAA